MSVELPGLSVREWGKAVGVGIATGAILAALNVLALKSHVSPLPKPLGLAFAESLLGRTLPLPVGLMFHLVWVTFFSVAYVVLWRHARTLSNAMLLAASLWLIVLVVFFPFVGWGFFGLSIGPQLIVAAAVSHLLFALVLWGLCRLLFEGPARLATPTP